MHDIIISLLILFLAFAADLLVGDPIYSFHPTRIIGRLIKLNEYILEKIGLFNIFGGIILVASTIVITLLLYGSIRYCLSFLNLYLSYLFDIFILYSTIALKDMAKHAIKIYEELSNNNLQAAREALSMIVGRSTQDLSNTEISKAAAESIAENFTDGFFSVVFWYTAGVIIGYILHQESNLYGICAALIYRAINTLDSMVGYKNTRYINFGKFAARIDDFANFIPARLSVLFICLSAFITKNSVYQCFMTSLNDRLKHSSPNSAHPESAISGALGIKLGGNTLYPFGIIHKPYIGKQYSQTNAETIVKAVRLTMTSAVVCITFIELAGIVLSMVI